MYDYIRFNVCVETLNSFAYPSLLLALKKRPTNRQVAWPAQNLCRKPKKPTRDNTGGNKGKSPKSNRRVAVGQKIICFLRYT